MCPSCGKLVGLDRVCPYCGKDTNSVSASVSRLGKVGQSGGIPVTIGFVLANLLVYLLIVMIGGQQSTDSGMELFTPDTATLLRLGMQRTDLVADGQWWRIVMPIFLHLGLLHVTFNTLTLWWTGRHLEQDIGSFAYFFMYVTAGIVGFLASQVMGIGGAGASGAVAGIIGCTIVKRRISDGNFGNPVTQQAIQLLVLNALFGLIVAKVNNVAHLGGFLTGAAMGAGFGFWEGRAFARRIWIAGAVAAGGVVVAAVTAMLMWQMPARMSDPATFTFEVNKAFGCAQQVDNALGRTRATLPPTDAENALRCLKDIKPLDPELDPLLADFVAGIRKAYDGRINGSLSRERDGIDAIDRAWSGMTRWLEAANKGRH